MNATNVVPELSRDAAQQATNRFVDYATWQLGYGNGFNAGFAAGVDKVWQLTDLAVVGLVMYAVAARFKNTRFDSSVHEGVTDASFLELVQDLGWVLTWTCVVAMALLSRLKWVGAAGGL